MMYEWMIRPILFKIFSKDPEKAHEIALFLLKLIGKQKWLAKLIELYSTYEDTSLEQELFGLKFRNPVGLAAGFDKNGVALRGFQVLGFGFIEIGTVTQNEQEGSPRPRIFYFPKDEAIINRRGFPNDGADKIRRHLVDTGEMDIPLGVSLGKSKNTPLEEAAADYLYSFLTLYFYGDYFTVNVSSPNMPNLRKLQEKEPLKFIITTLQRADKYLAERNHLLPKPILVKVAPDLSWGAIDEVLEVCLDCKVDGLIAVNTTTSRDGLSVPTTEEGGMSGGPLWLKAYTVVRYISERVQGQIPIIGVGGISSAEEAYEMLKYANLVQVYSSLVYKGPSIIYRINEGLKQLMERNGIKQISEIRQSR